MGHEEPQIIDRRPARALVGWLPADQAHQLLAGEIAQGTPDPEHVARANLARQTVAARAGGVDQSDLLSDAPASLDEYFSSLSSERAFAPFVTERWALKIADLDKVCAVQPAVFVDHAQDRAASVTDGDLVSAASVTLPLPSKTKLPIKFDEIGKAWIASSRNGNLRIAGAFRHISDEGLALGFVIAQPPSFVQVAFYRGRYVLRDGYHRCLGLLARGLTRAPVLYREFGQFESLGLQAGFLPEGVFLGARPPLMRDYLDDVVGTEVQLPAPRRTIILPGLELNG